MKCDLTGDRCIVVHNLHLSLIKQWSCWFLKEKLFLGSTQLLTLCGKLCDQIRLFIQSFLPTGWKKMKMETARAPWIIVSNIWLFLQRKNQLESEPLLIHLISHLPITHLLICEETGSILKRISSQALESSHYVPPKFSLLQAKQAQVSQHLFACAVACCSFLSFCWLYANKNIFQHPSYIGIPPQH